MPSKSSDFLEELANDPQYQEMLREKETKRAAFEAELDQDEKSLVRELWDAGVDVQSVWDLVNTNTEYPNAIPILVAHLSKDHHIRTVEGIVRALTVPYAQGIATSSLIELFKRTDPESELKWLLGAAIAETATTESTAEVIRLLEDKKHGRGREYLPLALVHLSNNEATPILKRMLNDPIVKKNAVKAISL